MVASVVSARPTDWPAAPPSDSFSFHPRTTDPELWRTTIPLVVRMRCGRHKGLIATWTAIHWLIVLHAASGRTHFGMREIAEEAGVGRNELAGPAGYIQRLINLGLLRIVGYKSFRGLREPRPVYHIDLVELERQSLELVPEVLREHHVDRPPPADPDPRQLWLFPLPPEGQAAPAAPAYPAHEGGPEPPCPTRGEPASRAMTHENGTGDRQADQLRGTFEYAGGRPTHENGTGTHVIGHAAPVLKRLSPEPGTDLARNRDIDRMNERMNEGVSQSLTPDLLQSLVTQATQAVLATLGAQRPPIASELPPTLLTIPPAPAGAEPLSFAVLELWQGDSLTVSRRETHHLAMLAAEYDGPSAGHGAYWLGRAILMADLCLGERGQARSLPYLRQILRRWRDEDSWGSDREVADAPRREAATLHQSRQVLRAAEETHPAVAAYIEALHETPNAVQASRIVEIVTDLEVWREVLRDWQLNGWGERSVGKMLDRYQKTIPGGADAPPPPSVRVIHAHPALTSEQRERWIRRFHAATTPAEKHAVLKRLAQEYPNE